MAESLGEVCPVVNVENRFVNDELGFFSEKISKQRVEDVASLFFLIIVKCDS